MKRKRMTVTVLVAALVAVTISSTCSGRVGGSGVVSAPTPYLPTHTVTIPAIAIPAVVVPTSTASTFSSNFDAFDYPPPSSPGAINAAVTQANIHPTATSPGTICVSGWTATIRPPASYTNALKKKDMAAEGIAAPKSAFELDHRTPLSSGGAPMDPKNLWVEPWDGKFGAHAKDAIELQVHNDICSGKTSLSKAQEFWMGDFWHTSIP